MAIQSVSQVSVSSASATVSANSDSTETKKVTKATESQLLWGPEQQPLEPPSLSTHTVMPLSTSALTSTAAPSMATVASIAPLSVSRSLLGRKVDIESDATRLKQQVHTAVQEFQKLVESHMWLYGGFTTAYTRQITEGIVSWIQQIIERELSTSECQRVLHSLTKLAYVYNSSKHKMFQSVASLMQFASFNPATGTPVAFIENLSQRHAGVKMASEPPFPLPLIQAPVTEKQCFLCETLASLRLEILGEQSAYSTVLLQAAKSCGVKPHAEGTLSLFLMRFMYALRNEAAQLSQAECAELHKLLIELVTPENVQFFLCVMMYHERSSAVSFLQKFATLTSSEKQILQQKGRAYFRVLSAAYVSLTGLSSPVSQQNWDEYHNQLNRMDSFEQIVDVLEECSRQTKVLYTPEMMEEYAFIIDFLYRDKRTKAFLESTLQQDFQLLVQQLLPSNSRLFEKAVADKRCSEGALLFRIRGVKTVQGMFKNSLLCYTFPDFERSVSITDLPTFRGALRGALVEERHTVVDPIKAIQQRLLGAKDLDPFVRLGLETFVQEFEKQLVVWFSSLSHQQKTDGLKLIRELLSIRPLSSSYGMEFCCHVRGVSLYHTKTQAWGQRLEQFLSSVHEQLDQPIGFNTSFPIPMPAAAAPDPQKLQYEILVFCLTVTYALRGITTLDQASRDKVIALLQSLALFSRDEHVRELHANSTTEALQLMATMCSRMPALLPRLSTFNNEQDPRTFLRRII